MIRRLLAATACAIVGGCAIGPAVKHLPMPDESISSRAPVAPSGIPAETGPDELPARALTMRECIEAALSRRGTIRSADRRILISHTRTDEAIGAILPRLSLDARLERRNNDRGAVFDGREPQVVSDRSVGTGTLSLIVPVYDFEGARGRVVVEEARTRAIESDALRARQDLALDVSRAYLRVLESHKILDVVHESLLVVESQLAISQDFQRAGLVARSDVLTAEVQLARRRQESIEAKNNVAIAIATLNRMIGADAARETTLAGVLEGSAWKGMLGEALATALAHRPDLQAIGERVIAARANVGAGRSEFTPGVYAFATADHTSDSFVLNKDWVTAGVGVKWSLFDGWASVARNNRRALDLRDAEDARDELAADVALDVRIAYQDVQEAAERVPVARQAIALGEENLRVVRDQYGAGLVTSADLLAEEERLASSRASYFRALYDYHDAIARLGHAVGADPLGGDGKDL
ncbi:MAG: TolC family protein [Planctomycetes bacterium]|nr:TolC family protein [Planctomycetota bacterium]